MTAYVGPEGQHAWRIDNPDRTAVLVLTPSGESRVLYDGPSSVDAASLAEMWHERTGETAVLVPGGVA